MKNSQLDRRSRYSQQVIKEALFTLLDEKSLSAITVTDICSKADVNRGTFYRYYKDVGDLFSQIEEAFTQEILKRLKDMGELTEGEIGEVLFDSLQIIEDNSDFILIIQKGNTNSRVVQSIMLFAKPYLTQMIQSFAPQIGEEDRSFTCEYILGGVASMVDRWNQESPHKSVEKMKELIMKLIMSSINWETGQRGR